MTAQDGLAAGMDQTRLTAAAQDRAAREQRQEAARQRLVCIPSDPDADGGDLAAYLGLDATPGPGTPCGSRAARVQRLATGQACVTCGTPAIKRRETADA